MTATDLAPGEECDQLSRFFDACGQVGNLTAVLERRGNDVRATTYEYMHARIRAIAARIAQSCGPDDRVAIFLRAGADAYAAELGALFSGRLFCPLETTYPIDRVLYCLADFSPRIVLTDVGGERLLAGHCSELVDVDALPAASDESPCFAEGAYVIYTSGSTGLPKGVKVSRRSLDKFLDWSLPFYNVRPGERWAQFSSLGFDLSIVDLLTCLLSGGTLVPVTGVDRTLPGRFVAESSIGIWHSVPSVIPMLLRESQSTRDQLRSLRLASFCGEPLLPQQVLALLQIVPNLQVVNTYGPTEGTLFCTAQPVDAALCLAASAGSLPIGHPIPGWSFEFEPSPVDDLSELIIASDFLSDGYISPTPDQARFARSVQSGLPSYRTGDLVRREGSSIFFAQRLDSQVKIRGNRLDLTEVEYQALQFGVSEAKAFVVESSVFLAVVLAPGTSAADLLVCLQDRLPPFAVPKDILVREELPRNANLKIETRKLTVEVKAKWNL